MTTRALGLVNTLVLVRLLPPADFGLVALATSFSQAVDWLSALGVEQALIRETHVESELYDTAFTMNLGRSALVALLIAAIAQPVAAFYGDMRLMSILFVLALAMLLSGLENVRVIGYQRDLAYEKQFRILVPPRIAGIVAAMTYALIYRDYWALVAGILTTRATRMVMTYAVLPCHPRITLRLWRRIVGFSFWVWATSMVQMVRDRADGLVIGRILGPASLGIYSVSGEIGSLASNELIGPLTAALFAGFSAARRAERRVADGYFRAISVTFMLTLPLGFGMSLLAAPIVQLALGPKWMGAIWLVRIFAVLSVARMITAFSGVLFNAHAMLTVQFRIMLVSLSVRVVLLFALIRPYGLMGAAMGAIGCVAVEEVLFLTVTFRHFDLRPLELLSSTWRCMLATAVMSAVLVGEGVGWAAAPASAAGSWGMLALGFSSGAVTYGVVLLSTWWATGRRAGAESYMLDVIQQIARHVGQRWSVAR